MSVTKTATVGMQHEAYAAYVTDVAGLHPLTPPKQSMYHPFTYMETG